MTHIMVDLETLSTDPTARIVSIGAVKFDAGRGVYDRFYCVVISPPFEPLMQSHIDDDGFRISSQTIAWWAEQSDEAKTVFHDIAAVPMISALESFSMWILQDTRAGDVRMWGNGASFDNVILSSAYRICNMEQPWKFYNDRCYRTMKHMHPGAWCARIGTHHNAVDDAETQAVHLLNMKVPLA